MPRPNRPRPIDCNIQPIVTKNSCTAEEATYNCTPTFADVLSSTTMNSEEYQKESLISSQSGSFVYKSTSTQTWCPPNILTVPVVANNQPSQISLWESTTLWNSLSVSDQSCVRATKNFVQSGYRAATLTNDKPLRRYHQQFEGLEVYGSSAVLAALVISGRYSPQRGTVIFRKWRLEPRSVPRGMSFKNVLDIERERIRSGTSFWFQK